MINSIFAFLLALAELLTVLGGHALGSDNIFYDWLVFGSPYSLFLNFFSKHSTFTGSPLFLMLISFHALKYALFIRAHAADERNRIRTVALVLEILYLCVSAYYINDS